jgi:hypothetical protein
MKENENHPYYWVIHEINTLQKNILAMPRMQKMELRLIVRRLTDLKQKIINHDPWIEVDPYTEIGESVDPKLFTYPEYNKGVLVFIPDEDNHVTSGMWDISKKWVLLDEYRIPETKVTHFMPYPILPKAYREEEQEKS